MTQKTKCRVESGGKLKSDTRPYSVRFSKTVQEMVGEVQLSELVHEVLVSLDGMVATSKTDTVLKINRLSLVTLDNGRVFPVKCSFVRGRDRDSLVLSVPKPIWADVTPCADCDQVGWKSLKTLTICDTCHGVGFVDRELEESPSGNL